MIVRIEKLLSPDQLADIRRRLDAATWADGRLTAGHQSAAVKNNLQLPQSEPAARDAGAIVVRALEGNASFVSATLPRHIYPPLFNRYQAGMGFGAHVDNAIRQIPGTHYRLRTDMSATLFLSAPEEYEGGELAVQDSLGSHTVKLAAGDMVVYPAGSVHRVQPVTRGIRHAAFFWVQSMVRDDDARALLFELDGAIRDLTRTAANAEALLRLTACYHNLLRRWADL